jgi:hypothetical protein
MLLEHTYKISMSSPKLFYSEILKCLGVIYIKCGSFFSILRCVIADWLSSLSPMRLHLQSSPSFTPRTSHCVLRNAKPSRLNLAQVPGVLELHNVIRDWIAPTTSYQNTSHESLQASSSKIDQPRIFSNVNFIRRLTHEIHIYYSNRVISMMRAFRTVHRPRFRARHPVRYNLLQHRSVASTKGPDIKGLTVVDYHYEYTVHPSFPCLG